MEVKKEDDAEMTLQRLGVPLKVAGYIKDLESERDSFKTNRNMSVEATELSALDPFADIRERAPFSVIYADPPWYYDGGSVECGNAAADKHYETMRCGDIAALPVSEISAWDS